MNLDKASGWGQWVKVALIALLLAASWGIGIRYLIDFRVFYAAGKAAHDGTLSVIYNYQLLGENGPRFFYAPFTLCLLKTLGSFSLETARYLWLGLQTLAFAAFWLSLRALYPWMKEKRLSVGWVLVFAASIASVHLNFQSNNIGLMLAGLFCVAEVCARQRSSVLGMIGGMLVAFGAVIKVYPLFLAAYYLIARKKSVGLGVMLGLIVALVWPVISFGPSAAFTLHKEFVQAVISYGNDNPILGREDILCLPSLIQRGLAPFYDQKTLQLVSTLIGGSLAAAFLFYARRPKRGVNVTIDPNVSLHNWALALLIMTLINPSTRPHYFITYVPAVASLVSWAREGKSSSVFALGSLVVGLALAVGTAQGVVGRTLNDALEWKNIPTLGYLILGIALVVKLVLDRRSVQVRPLTPSYR